MAKEFKCSNYGVCPEADKDTIFQEVDVEEVDGKYICPKCGQELEVIGGDKKPKGKLIAIIVAAVVLIGGGTVIALSMGNKDKDQKKPEAAKVVDEPAPVIAEPEPVVEPEPQPQSKPQPTPQPASNKYNLGWGTYEGPMQDGKPHGVGGEITVTKDYNIDTKNGSSKSVAKGDKIVQCKFVNGKLSQGYIHHANGQQESLYIGN